MDFLEFFNCCKATFAANSELPTPSEDQVRKLYELTDIMLEVNKKMNLTAIKEPEAIILKHYADSLMISRFLPENSSVIDVGCGAGFPTLPLAIFRPNLKITALDSTQKRIDYVKSTAKTLGLDNVTAICGRAEELANDKAYRESFDLATARAVAALPVLSELCLPFVKIGGKFVAMKGQKGESEAAEAQNAIKKCGGTIIDTYRTPLYSQNGDWETRIITEIAKTSPTPREFPRHFSKISKRPL